MKNTCKKINPKLSKKIKSKTQLSETKNDRIAKVIARSGLCSRREAERWILNGKVKINNKTLLQCAINVTSKDKIEVKFNEPYLYLVFELLKKILAIFICIIFVKVLD